MQDFEKLIQLIQNLGWDIALPDLNDDDEVPGMVIGNENYVQSVIECLPDDFSDKFKTIDN